MAVVEEALLQLAAVHARHPEIEDQAFGRLQLLRSKKGLRRREGGHPETSRPEEAVERLTHRLVIIDDGDQRLVTHR